MNKLTAFLARQGKRILFVLFILFIVTIQSCFHYRVINTFNEPVTEARDTVVRSYFWGLVNKPQNFHVPNCDSCAAIDEIVFSKNFGQSLLTVITLGIVSPIKVEWRCHKACLREVPGL